MEPLKKYNEKRNFKKTNEPKGKKRKSSTKLVFVIQRHWARKEHFDIRLEWNGVLKSFAVPKGLPSFKEKRLAIAVEDHPYSYKNFEGVIPKGEYGGGTVMIVDEGYWEPLTTKVSFKKELKFFLHGKRTKGKFVLVPLKNKDWLLIRESEGKNISYTTSLKSGQTKKEIANPKEVHITHPNKKIYPNVTKQNIVKYYQKVFPRLFPFLEKRPFSSIRKVENATFFKRHFDQPDLKKVMLKNKDYYYIKNKNGLIEEVQRNGYEFHLWGGNSKPNMMVFDLDPDEEVSLKDLRNGVKDLKKLLDELGLVFFLKTSGGKGYHIVVPFTSMTSWKEFTKFSYQVASVLEQRFPEKYTTKMSKKLRKGKIFIDWMRNKKGSTSVAPYSLRLRKKCSVSMPIFWNELDKIKPDEITMEKALQRLKRKDPWEDFFTISQ